MNTPLRHLAALITGLFTLLLSSCTSDDGMAENCSQSAIGLTIAGQPQQLSLVSSNMIRITNIAGSYKMLNVEAIADSVKVIANIITRHYPNYTELQSDSIPVGVYTYSRTGADSSGRILVGVSNGSAYKFAITDTASVNITTMDPVNRTITGSYYVRTSSPAFTATGYFNKVCFQSLR
jgi:hypothetical protein